MFFDEYNGGWIEQRCLYIIMVLFKNYDVYIKQMSYREILGNLMLKMYIIQAFVTLS